MGREKSNMVSEERRELECGYILHVHGNVHVNQKAIGRRGGA